MLALTSTSCAHSTQERFRRMLNKSTFRPHLASAFACAYRSGRNRRMPVAYVETAERTGTRRADFRIQVCALRLALCVRLLPVRRDVCDLQRFFGKSAVPPGWPYPRLICTVGPVNGQIVPF
jgi:hypothetical protein